MLNADLFLMASEWFRHKKVSPLKNSRKTHAKKRTECEAPLKRSERSERPPNAALVISQINPTSAASEAK